MQWDRDAKGRLGIPSSFTKPALVGNGAYIDVVRHGLFFVCLRRLKAWHLLTALTG